jgi:arylsulfatase A-like enzyme
MNTTHMHLRTHTKPGSLGQSGRWQSPYHDTMIDHDRHVGQLLDALDELGIAEDTIVIYSTDNGPHANTWPDGATTPFRSEKDTNWEGAFRVPELIRWPGQIPAGAVSNEIIQHHDWLPTFLAAGIWAEPFTILRVPKLFNLRTDPFERADGTSNSYWDWFIDRDYITAYGVAITTAFLQTFKDFRPRHEPASFSVNKAVDKLKAFLAKD